MLSGFFLYGESRYLPTVQYAFGDLGFVCFLALRMGLFAETTGAAGIIAKTES